MPAILFGSIGTVADTSELQRRAFNDAFARCGLDWNWSRDEYREMLNSNGGVGRVAHYAATRGAVVDAKAVHAEKTEIFQGLLGVSSIVPRPGVLATIAEARHRGYQLGFVTTTSQTNVDALLSALHPHINAETFDLVVHAGSVREPKPAPAAYEFALEKMSEEPNKVVAIEDNSGGIRAAAAAGIKCIAFPNGNTVDGDFSAAAETVEELDPVRVFAVAAW